MIMRRFAALAAAALSVGASLAVTSPARADSNFDYCSNAVTWQGWQIQACITDNPASEHQVYGYTKFTNVGARTDVWIDVTLVQNCGSGWVNAGSNGQHAYPATPSGSPATNGNYWSTSDQCHYETYGYITDNGATVASNWSPDVGF